MTVHPPPIAAPLGSVTTDRLHLRRFADSDLDGCAAHGERIEIDGVPAKLYSSGSPRARLVEFVHPRVETEPSISAAARRG